MKAFAYLRVSTDRQEVEAQRSQAHAFAAYRGHEILNLPDEINVSGATPFADRPVGAEIMRRIDECGVIIFTKVDRMSRDTADAIATFDLLVKTHGKNVAFLDLGVDTSTVMGRAFFQMSAVWAEAERGRISERIREKLVESRKRPGWHHGPAGYGYRNLARTVDGRKVDGGLHESTLAEASTIERVRHLRAAGASLREIAAQLQAMMIPTRRGGQWRQSTVAKIVGRLR